jgi:hypothetical protein
VITTSTDKTHQDNFTVNITEHTENRKEYWELYHMQQVSIPLRSIVNPDRTAYYCIVHHLARFFFWFSFQLNFVSIRSQTKAYAPEKTTPSVKKTIFLPSGVSFPDPPINPVSPWH